AAGYADGIPRLLSNKGKVIINGKFAPITGRVCMDQLMVDVTDIPDARVGDIATFIGTSGGLTIEAAEVAEMIGTIDYEIVCGLVRPRVPRIDASEL
nr:alanine racemase [Clostridia bacterium]